MQTQERVGRHAALGIVEEPRRSRHASHARRPRLRRGALVVISLGCIWLIWSIVLALTAPGTDSMAAKLAEWGRVHHLGWVITELEKVQYNLSKPAVGGTVAGGIPKVGPRTGPASTAPASQAHHPSRTVSAYALPAPIVPPVANPLPGEGQWQNLLQVNGHVAAAVAYVRPDSIHTSYLTAVVWMNPKLLRFNLHPGYQVPGGAPQASDQLTQSERATVLATFNSGFQMVDANGGYWQNGTTIKPLRAGAASMVITRNGRLLVERWPGGAPPAGIAAVRQNLVPLIEHGQISPLVPNASTNAWGVTVGNHNYVWRSAVGVRPDGSVLFVLGPALNIQSLANIMHAAGAVNAMELDINRDWTSFITYTHPNGQVVPSKLTAAEVASAYRYLQPSSRDFVAVTPR